MIYFGSWDSKLYALAPDGTKKWAFATGFLINSSPAIGADGTVYVGSSDGFFYAVNPDGTLKWSFAIPPGVDSSPAIEADGTIYFGANDNKVYAMSPDGTKKWTFTTGGALQRASPVIGPNGAIYIGSRDGVLYALNRDGSWGWQFSTPSEINGTPAIASDGTIYFGCSDKKVYALAGNGAKLWEFVTGSSVVGSPAIATNGTVYIGSTDAKFYALAGSAGLAPGPWPMFHRDVRHTGALAPLPVVRLSSPTSGTDYTVGDVITLTAEATSRNGPIVDVAFYSGTNLLGDAANAPYTFSWSNAPAGDIRLAAVALDSSGASIRSASVLITVLPKQAGFSIQLVAEGTGTLSTSPRQALYAPGTLVTISATAGRYYAFSQWSDGDTNQSRAIIVGTTNFFTAVFTNTVPLEIQILRQWDRSYAGPGLNYLTSIAPVSDGGYLLGGYANGGRGQTKTSTNYGDYDFWLVKVDAQGRQQWDADYGGTGPDLLGAILPGTDGGYLAGGSSSSDVGGSKTLASFGKSDFWLVKIDDDGAKQWERVFGGSGDDNLTSMVPATDGGYLLGGTTQSGISGNKTTPAFGNQDFWVIKIDAQGNKQWEQTFGAGGDDKLNALLPTADGGYLAGGATGPASLDYWLLKFSASGQRSLGQSYGGTGDDTLRAMASTRGGGYLLGGESYSSPSGNKTAPNFGSDDFWVVKIGGDGTQLWDRSYGGPGYDSISAIQPLADGHYILAGTTQVNTSQMRVIEVNSAGVPLADAVFGANSGGGFAGGSALTALQVAADGSLLLGGPSQSLPGEGKSAPLRSVQDFYLVKASINETPVGAPVIRVNHLFNPANSYSNIDRALIEIDSSFSGGRIYYTLEGSAPGTNTFGYTNPFSLYQSATLRAVAFSTDGVQQAASDPVGITIIPVLPEILSVAGLSANQTIGVEFSEPVDAASATNLADYSVSNAAAITNAVLQSDGRSVQLFLAGNLANGIRLTVNGVSDLAGHAIAANTSVTVPVSDYLLADIGQPVFRGQVFTAEPGAFEVRAAGADVGGTNDAFSYLYQPRTGDFDVAVQVKDLFAGAQSSKAGLMVRENLAAGSRELSGLATPPNAASMWLALYRAFAGGRTTNWPNSFTPQGLPYPDVWIRLRRQGDRFTAYAGTNGVYWAPFGEITPNPPYPATVLVGLATTAGNDVNPARASYQNFSDVTGTSIPTENDRWDTLHFALGSTADSYYSALAASGDHVYVGGNFSSVGPVSANNVVRWDNPGWSALGSGAGNGLSGLLIGLAAGPDGALYAGGKFTAAGGVAAQNIARWNGTNWSALGAGISGGISPTVYAVAVADDGRVYAGGSFAVAGNIPANNVAVWAGAAWSNLGAGLTSSSFPGGALVRAIAVNGNSVYVGGQFDQAGGVRANCVARWDGTQWSALGEGVALSGGSPFVDALAVRGEEIFIGGDFSVAGVVPANRVARWDGQSWSALNSGADSTVQAMAILGSHLFVAGNFNHIGGQEIRGLAQWDGTGWSALGGGLGGSQPYASLLAARGTNLFVAGRFAWAGAKPAALSGIWSLTNAPPSVRMTAPVAGAFLPLLSASSVTNVLLTVDAYDLDGSVRQVEFFSGAQRLGLATNPPFSFLWTNVPIGHYDLFARATDNLGEFCVSSLASVVVDVPNNPPMVRFTSPTDGAQFILGATIQLTAAASDTDGSIDHVDFLVGLGPKIGSGTQAPYQFNWTAAPAGDIALTAIAVDNRGATTRSEPVHIHVNAPPSVSIVKPLDGAVSYTTNTLVIQIQASDPDGAVARVALYQNDLFLAAEQAPPYEFDLVNLAPGTNTYVVRATDDRGAQASSAPVRVFVLRTPVINQPPTVILVSPFTNDMFVAPTALTLVAQASDVDGAVQSVEFRANGTSLGIVHRSPFALGLGNIGVGTYRFTAVASDNQAASTESAPVSVAVVADPTNTPSFTLTDLGTLGGANSSAAAIDRIGRVTGSSQLARNSEVRHAFVWQSGVMRDLGTLGNQSFAVAINGAGTVLGATSFSGGNQNQAFLWNPIEAMVALPTLGVPAVQPFDLNDAGQAVGTATGLDRLSYPVLWANGTITNLLGNLTGSAQAINSRGQIVGGYQAANSAITHAFLWDRGQVMDLGTLGGTYSQATAINDNGQVVGEAVAPDQLRHAFIWEKGSMRNLGNLIGSESWAESINTRGQIVGQSVSLQGYQRAVLWQNGVLFDLNQFVPSDQDGVLTLASDINDSGMIVGTMFQFSDGIYHAFLLAPVPPPTSSNAPPTVSLLSPTNNATVNVDQAVTLVASASDSDGVVARVDFYVGNTVLGHATNSPFTFVWHPTDEGVVGLKAVAVDDGGAVASSPVASINIAPTPGSRPQYVVVDLGPLAMTESRGYGLNNFGDIVGQARDSSGRPTGFINRGGILLLLNQQPVLTELAVAINDSNQVAVIANQRSYLYQNGQFTDLGTLGGPSSTTIVRGLNSLGQAVGTSENLGGDTRAFLYDGQSLMDLGTLGGGTSQANSINDTGAVVGWSQTTSSYRAFVYDSQNGMQALGTLGGDGSQAWGINDQGAIVGQAATAAGSQNAFIYQAAMMRGLGTLGGLNSFAYGINNSNLVVGYYEDTNSKARAFLWETNRMFDLNRLIPPASNWILTSARAINDAGQIVGVGQLGAADQTDHAVLLNPIPAPGQSNHPPAVAIVSPTNGAAFFEGDTVTLSAQASDQDGLIAGVQFYVGTRLLGAGTNPPYALLWTNVTPGNYTLTAVATDDGGASQTSAPLNIDVRAFNPNAPRVAILSVSTPTYDADIRDKLRHTGLFSGVDLISLTFTNPTPPLTELEEYDSVLVYSWGALSSSNALGDRLADYIDAGHGVVLALYAEDSAPGPVSGRLVRERYPPWSETRDDFSTFLTLVKSLPQHPILAGVTNFNGGSFTVFQRDVVLSPGGVRIADWNNGQPLVVAREVAGGRVVGLNFFPVSSDARAGSWDSRTDGARLLGNALVWAAGPPTPGEIALATFTGQATFPPGRDIVLTTSLTNLAAQPVQVSFYAYSRLLATVTNSPFSYTWPRPAVSNYLATAVVTDLAGNILASRGLSVSVDSRLTIDLFSPTNGAVFYLPTIVNFQVAVSDPDAPVAKVEYWRDGTERLASITNAPFEFVFSALGAGVQNISAQATDALGATRITPTVSFTVIDPAASVQEFWLAAAGDWLSPTNWSKGVPRPQDNAYIDNGGVALLSSDGGAASNLVVGSSATGQVFQTTASLMVGQSVTLGELQGSAGTFELDGSGRLTAASIFVGLAGSGRFAQSGGTNALMILSLSGDVGGQGSYLLSGGQLKAGAEYIGRYNTALFQQTGGTNTAGQSLTVGQGQNAAGTYELEGGLLRVPIEIIGSDFTKESAVHQTGGRHEVLGELHIGDSGLGRLTISNGVTKAGELFIGTGGALEITFGFQTNLVQVSGQAHLGGRLLLHLADGFTPALGDVFELLSYESFQGSFANLDLPPTSNGISWKAEYLPKAVRLTAVQPPTIVIVSAVTPDSQPNLSHQLVRITNPGAEPLKGARIFLPGLPMGVQVYNAAGTESGVPFVEYDSPIASGQTVQIEVQFFVPGPALEFIPSFVLDLVHTNPPVNPSGAPLALQSQFQRDDGAFGFEFNPRANQTYYIQYSDDLLHWATVEIPLVGTGGATRWIDDGPPKTDSNPQTQRARFYRVMLSTNFTDSFFAIQRASRTTGGAFGLEFNPLANRIYYIEYGSDLIGWKTVTVPLVGTGGPVQWIDNGPPQTDSPPQSQPARFYRIILSP